MSDRRRRTLAHREAPLNQRVRGSNPRRPTRKNRPRVMTPSEATGHIPCATQRSLRCPGQELRAPARRRGAGVPLHRCGGRGGSRARRVSVAFLERNVLVPNGRGTVFGLLERAAARDLDLGVVFGANPIWRPSSPGRIVAGQRRGVSLAPRARCSVPPPLGSSVAPPPASEDLAPNIATRSFHGDTELNTSSGMRGPCGRCDASSWSSTSESTRCSTTAVRSGSPARSRTPIARGGHGERVFRGSRSPSIRRSTGREGRSSEIDRRSETWLSLFQRRMS